MSSRSKNDERKARRAALWVLYLIDVAEAEPSEALELSRETVVGLEDGPGENWGRVVERVEGVFAKWDAVNEAVQDVSPRWKIARMAPIDRNILRLGAWELLHGKIEPPIAVIDHCVDLAKEYGEKSTPGFVNGLLDQICTDHGIEMQ